MDKLTPHSVYYLIDPITLIPRYIGFSEKPEKRFEGHVKHLRGSTHKVAWIRSLLNIGRVPILSIRCIVVSKFEACRIETALIALLRSHGVDLTNATPGGEGGATMTGKKSSAETCAKIGAAHRGKQLSLKQRLQISEANKNRSPETHAKMSASARARPRNAMTPETKAKISAIHKGRRMGGVSSHSVETRAKMSEAKRVGWARRKALVTAKSR